MGKLNKVFFSVLVVFVSLILFSTSAFAGETQIGTVTASGVNMRSGPGLQYKVIASLSKGNKVKLLSQQGDWYKVSTYNNKIGWARNTYIAKNKKTTSRGGSTTSKTGDGIVTFAKQFLGVKYVWGGSSPSGFDCSGFVSYVYKNFGYQLNRVSSDQARQGVEVAKADLKPGQMVFFNTNHGDRINHAGIYIGDGKFIHASSGKGEVTINSLTSGFYLETYVTARRMF